MSPQRLTITAEDAESLDNVYRLAPWRLTDPFRFLYCGHNRYAVYDLRGTLITHITSLGQPAYKGPFRVAGSSLKHHSLTDAARYACARTP